MPPRLVVNQPAQANSGAEKPASPSYAIPNASTFARVAFAIVSVSPAGWKMFVSFAGSPFSMPNETTSSTSMSTASPIFSAVHQPVLVELHRRPLDAHGTRRAAARAPQAGRRARR